MTLNFRPMPAAVDRGPCYDPWPLHPSPPDTWRTPIHAHIIVWLSLVLMYVALVWASYDGGVSLARHHAFDIGVGTGYAAKVSP